MDQSSAMIHSICTVNLKVKFVFDPVKVKYKRIHFITNRIQFASNSNQVILLCFSSHVSFLWIPNSLVFVNLDRIMKTFENTSYFINNM